jgi:hypothetical protein
MSTITIEQLAGLVGNANGVTIDTVKSAIGGLNESQLAAVVKLYDFEKANLVSLLKATVGYTPSPITSAIAKADAIFADAKKNLAPETVVVNGVTYRKC